MQKVEFQSDRKICSNCQAPFLIVPADFSLYKKLKVPPPTWCSECRCIRRMVHRNERNLYRRTCDITGKNMISIYRADCPYTICDQDYYFSDAFDATHYGREYDPSRTFFDQFYDFAKTVPLAGLFLRNSVNCVYNQDMGECSNCYLCSRTHNSQNILYGYRVNKSSDCTDCFQATEASEFLYDCFDTISCSNSKYLHICEKCSDSAFLYNCVGCVDCFMCTNQRNKSNCYKNVQYSTDEYKKIVESYDLGTRSGTERALSEFEDFVNQFPHKNLTVIRSNDVSGDNIIESKDSRGVFNVKKLHNCAYIWDSKKFTDSMDTYSGMNADLIYESTATTSHSSNCHFCVRVYESSIDCEYSWFLKTCKNCFGCSGLFNKEYCIFNKQYTKEEYEAKVKEIKDNMVRDHEYGEFFPLSMSPFTYNDTVAHEYFPLTEETVERWGMQWGTSEEKNYATTMQAIALPDSISGVTDDILKEVIACEHDGTCNHGCTKAFRIVTDELIFYRKRNIPLPKQCPNCRYYRRLAYRNPTCLRDLTCMCANGQSVYKNTVLHDHGEGTCGKKIETTIPADSKKIIYCESCYQREVI